MSKHADIIERLENATEWRHVPGWPYEASDTGVLRSARTGRAIKPTITHNGYEKCTFQVNKIRKNVRVHRAIAEAWYGLIPAGMVINHVDGNKRNNAPPNLEVVTQAENEAHAVACGLKASGDRNGMRLHPQSACRGSKNALAKLTEAKVLAIRAERSRGDTLALIAARYGVDQSLISQIARRKIWTHI